MLYVQIYVITITRLKLLSLAVSGVCMYIARESSSPSQCLVDRCLCGGKEGRMGGFRLMTKSAVHSYLMGKRGRENGRV